MDVAESAEGFRWPVRERGEGVLERVEGGAHLALPVLEHPDHGVGVVLQ